MTPFQGADAVFRIQWLENLYQTEPIQLPIHILDLVHGLVKKELNRNSTCKVPN